MTIERLAPKIATYIFTRASVNTSTGNWHVDFEEINSFYSEYNVKLEDNPELLSAVEDALYSQYGDGILDLEIYDNEFDLVLGFDYCVNEVDFEEEDTASDLPEVVECSIKEFKYQTEEELEEQISNFLSNNYYFCVNSFNYRIENKTVIITDIDWDTEE